MTHLALSTVIAIAAVLPAISAQSSGRKDLPGESHQSLAPCRSYAGDTSGEMAVVSSFIPEPAYVEVPIEQIKKMVPLLNTTTLEGIHSEGDAGTAAQLTNKTEYILSKTGEAVTDLLRRTPNLLADENVRLTDQSLNSGFKWQSTTDYVYRIVH